MTNSWNTEPVLATNTYANNPSLANVALSYENDIWKWIWVALLIAVAIAAFGLAFWLIKRGTTWIGRTYREPWNGADNGSFFGEGNYASSNGSNSRRGGRGGGAGGF